MACIDKTYTDSWEEYQEVKKWMNEHTFTCPNGCKVRMGDCVYPWSKEDFEETPGREKPIINTNWTEDYFLIKYCPIKLVQDRMKTVYSEDSYNEILAGTSDWDTYEERVEYGTGYRVAKSPKWKLNRCLWGFNKGKPVYRDFFLEITHNDMPLVYNRSIDKWIAEFDGELGVPDESFFKGVHTIRALKRNLKKWKLPKGTVVKATGRYTDQDWEFFIV